MANRVCNSGKVTTIIIEGRLVGGIPLGAITAIGHIVMVEGRRQYILFPCMTIRTKKE